MTITEVPEVTEATLISIAEPRHHHVMAVQDWGGSQEFWRSWDDQWTCEQAMAHAAAMADADSAYVSGDVDRYMAAREKYGDDRFSDLISGNVCPGWNAIWVISCPDDCLWDLIELEDIQGLKPWWTPARERPACPLHDAAPGKDIPGFACTCDD